MWHAIHVVTLTILAPHRNLLASIALMREAFPGDPLMSKMSARWITNWAQCRRPPRPSTKAAVERWINNLAPETHDENDPYCFMHDVKEDAKHCAGVFMQKSVIVVAQMKCAAMGIASMPFLLLLLLLH